MTDELSERLMALRDHLRPDLIAIWLGEVLDEQRAKHPDDRITPECASAMQQQISALEELQGLLTALPRQQVEETKDDPRNPASVSRSETDPTR